MGRLSMRGGSALSLPTAVRHPTSRFGWEVSSPFPPSRPSRTPLYKCRTTRVERPCQGRPRLVVRVVHRRRRRRGGAVGGRVGGQVREVLLHHCPSSRLSLKGDGERAGDR